MSKQNNEIVKAIAAAIKANPQPDRDSFASLTGGLKDNWVFILAIFGVGMFILNGYNESVTVNRGQDQRIQASEQSITLLTTNFEAFKEEMRVQFSTSNKDTNEIIRRLDLVQKDIEIIKGTNNN